MANKNILITGGAAGADTQFAKVASERGDQIVILTFPGGPGIKGLQSTYLEFSQLERYSFRLHAVAEAIGKKVPQQMQVRKLILRNFLQVEGTSETGAPKALYAVAGMDSNLMQGRRWVLGGTGWAVHYACLFTGIPIYVYDAITETWKEYDRTSFDWRWREQPSPPTGVYVGIGHRQPNERSLEQIRALYQGEH